MARRISSILIFLAMAGCSSNKPEPASLGKALNEASKENDRLAAEIAQLKSQIAELNRNNALLAEEKRRISSDADSWSRKQQETEQKTKLYADRNGELAKQIENLTKENQRLAKENQDLKDTLKGLVAPADKKKTQTNSK